jgi:hypothetical protein
MGAAEVAQPDAPTGSGTCVQGLPASSMGSSTGQSGAFMSLSDLAALGSLVGGCAVLASLVYLGIQTRQTHRNQRSLLLQQRSTAGMESMFRAADPQFARVFAEVERNPRAVDAVSLSQYMTAMHALWIWLADGYLHREAGLFDKEAFEPVVSNIKAQLASRSGRAMWLMTKDTGFFSPGFVRFVGALLPSVPVRKSEDLMPAWNAALDEAEKAMR